MKHFDRCWMLLAGAVLLSPCVLNAQCYRFTPPIVPFAQVYYISAANASGDRLVVGKMDYKNLSYFPIQFISGHQKFCGMMELAPRFFAEAYVPTQQERTGDFSDFAGLLLDPVSNAQFPGGIIPISRIGDPMAWRISSITVSLANLASVGAATVTASNVGLPPPKGFKTGSVPSYYEITSAAQISGLARVCIGYPGTAYADESKLKVFHYEGGGWIDRTVSLDTTKDLACADVGSLSPFALFEPQGDLQKERLYLSQFAGGGGIVSEIVLANPSSTVAVSGVAEFFDDGGLPLPVGLKGFASQAGFGFSIKPLGGIIVASDGQGSQKAGAVRVSSSVPLAGFIRFNLPGLGIAGVGSGEPLSGFITPVRARAGLYTGIALHSPETASIVIALSLVDGDGQVVPDGTTSVSNFPASGHFALFVHQLFPKASLDDFDGYLIGRVTGGKVCATALELGTAAGQFTTLPVAPLK